jgi:SET domain-containing protein
MLLVKTRIGLSPINGVGLFAAQFIPKGAVTWRFSEGLDSRIEKRDLEKVPAAAKDSFMKYLYFSRRTMSYVLCCDDARFFNHSPTPNVGDADEVQSDEGVDIALRDINEGEELTCDYRLFDIHLATNGLRY